MLAHFYTDGIIPLLVLSPGKDVCKSTHHGCEHICVNSGDSYICKCSEGFVLAEDGRHCRSKWYELGTLLPFGFGTTIFFFLEYFQATNSSPLASPINIIVGAQVQNGEGPPAKHFGFYLTVSLLSVILGWIKISEVEHLSSIGESLGSIPRTTHTHTQKN
jgi:hypothetical protein